MYGQSTNINDTNVYVNIHSSESDEDLTHAHATITRPNFRPSVVKAKIRPGVEAKISYGLRFCAIMKR